MFDLDCKAAKTKVNALLRRWKLMRNAEPFRHYMDQKQLFKWLTKQKKGEHSRNLNARLRVFKQKRFKTVLESPWDGKKSKIKLRDIDLTR